MPSGGDDGASSRRRSATPARRHHAARRRAATRTGRRTGPRRARARRRRRGAPRRLDHVRRRRRRRVARRRPRGRLALAALDAGASAAWLERGTAATDRPPHPLGGIVRPTVPTGIDVWFAEPQPLAPRRRTAPVDGRTRRRRRPRRDGTAPGIGPAVRLGSRAPARRRCRTSCAPSTRAGWLAHDRVDPAARWLGLDAAAARSARPGAPDRHRRRRRRGGPHRAPRPRLRRGAGALLRRAAAHRARLARAPHRHRRPRATSTWSTTSTPLGHGHPQRRRGGRAAAAHCSTPTRASTTARSSSSPSASRRPLPDALDTVFLVNSGSEAVDLALRLALAATGRRDVVAVREAYHGWTYAIRRRLDLDRRQPQRARDAGPTGCTPSTRPNPYRGVHRGRGCRGATRPRPPPRIRRARGVGPPAGRLHRRDVLRQRRRHPAARRLSRRGLRRGARGRRPLRSPTRCRSATAASASWFWGFEQQGVVPDIVAVAKADGQRLPARRGHHDARDRRRASRAQGYFFSSTGGSPASSVARPGRARRVPRRGAAGERRCASATHLKAPPRGARDAASAHRRRARPGPLPRRRVRARPRHARAGDRGDGRDLRPAARARRHHAADRRPPERAQGEAAALPRPGVAPTSSSTRSTGCCAKAGSGRIPRLGACLPPSSCSRSLPALLILVLGLVARAVAAQRVTPRVVQYAPERDTTVLRDALLVDADRRAASAALIDLAVKRKVRLIAGVRSASRSASRSAPNVVLTADELALLEALFGPEHTPGRVRRFSSDRRALAGRLQSRRAAHRARPRPRRAHRRAPHDVARRHTQVLAYLGMLVEALFIVFALIDGDWPRAHRDARRARRDDRDDPRDAGRRGGGTCLPARPRREHLEGLRRYLALAEADRLRVLQSPSGAELRPTDAAAPRSPTTPSPASTCTNGCCPTPCSSASNASGSRSSSSSTPPSIARTSTPSPTPST